MRVRATDREGFVIPVVVFALAILGLLASVSLRTADDGRRAARALRESGAALYAAEAGMNLVRGTASDTFGTNLLDSIGKTLAAGDSADLGWLDLPGGTSYRAVIQRVDDGGSVILMYLLSVEGRGVGSSGGQRSLAVTLRSQAIFENAMQAGNSISIGGGVVDGDVTANGDITFAGGAGSVDGDASAGGTVSHPGQVAGTVLEGTPPVTFPSVECPSTPFGPGFQGQGHTFDAVTGNQTIAGQQDATFSTGTYYFHDFTQSGQGDLVVPAGQSVQIYVSGTLSIQGSGFVNANNTSQSLQIWACGTDTSEWAINAGGDVWMTLYAPNHVVNMNGQGNRTGAFVALDIVKQTSANVTYDQTLLSSVAAFPVLGSWTQLSR